MLLGLQAAVAADVLKREALLGEYTPDEQPSMAVLRVLLAAHHRDAVLVDPTGEPFDPGLEPLRRGYEVVPDVALIVVEPVLRRTAPELVAEEHVANSRSG